MLEGQDERSLGQGLSSSSSRLDGSMLEGQDERSLGQGLSSSSSRLDGSMLEVEDERSLGQGLSSNSSRLDGGMLESGQGLKNQEGDIVRGGIDGRFFRVERKGLTGDGGTVFDLLYISQTGNYATTTGKIYTVGFPDKVALAAIIAGYGVINFSRHFHPLYLQDHVESMDSNNSQLIWLNPKINNNDKILIPNSDGMTWDWSYNVVSTIWEEQALNNMRSKWSAVEIRHEKKQSQRQRDKALLYSVGNYLLDDSKFREDLMVAILNASKRLTEKSETTHQGKTNSFASVGKHSLPHDINKYVIEATSKDKRKIRQSSGSVTVTTRTKKPKV
jgi:hypothetical protein